MDADDFAVKIEQRAAGVAADQGAVGLDGELGGDFEDAAHTDDGGSVGAKAAGVPDGDDPLAFFQLGGFAHFEERIFPLVEDFDHAAVDAGVLAQGFPLEAFAIGEHDDGVLVGSAGDVPGGEDEAAFVDDDAGALALPDFQVDDGGHDFLDDFLHVLFDRAQFVYVGRRRFLEHVGEG